MTVVLGVNLGIIVDIDCVVGREYEYHSMYNKHYYILEICDTKINKFALMM